MLKLVEITKIETTTIESQIAQYKRLSDQIKELEALKEKVKKEMLEGYFATNEVYENENGRVLATYKESERESFNQSKFKTDHNDIFSLYCEKKLVKTFLVK